MIYKHLITSQIYLKVLFLFPTNSQKHVLNPTFVNLVFQIQKLFLNHKTVFHNNLEVSRLFVEWVWLHNPCLPFFSFWATKSKSREDHDRREFISCYELTISHMKTCDGEVGLAEEMWTLHTFSFGLDNTKLALNY